MAEVLGAALVGNLKEDDIKRAFLVAGELERWERIQPSHEGMPPSRAHSELVRLLRDFAQVKAALHEIKGSTE